MQIIRTRCLPGGKIVQTTEGKVIYRGPKGYERVAPPKHIDPG